MSRIWKDILAAKNGLARFWIVQNSCQSLALELFVSATHVQIERFKKSYSW
jgi:hypothetical protein